MPPQKHERYKTAKESAEPGEPKPADQYGRIGNQLSGTLQNVIQACSHQAREPGDADDKKPFVVMAGLAALLVAARCELRAAAVIIRLRDVCGDQQPGGHHEAQDGEKESSVAEYLAFKSIHEGSLRLTRRYHSKMIPPSPLLKLPERNCALTPGT